ncbi:MAG: cation transporter [Clostridia bacterium]|nr:cation transporter [Clostridia bacterium]
MTNLLLKLFINHKTFSGEAQRKAAVGTLSGAVGIICNLFISGFKFVLGYLSASAALIADAANNLSDLLTSIISIVGFKVAAKPADEEHPFGHGRYEYVLSIIVSFSVFLMGAELLKSGIQKIIHPAGVTFSPLLLAVIIVSVLVKLWMSVFNFSLAKKEGITALKAVARDSLSDCLSTSAVLISILLEKFFGWQLDGYVATAVSLLVIWSGISIFRDSIHPLIGAPAKKESVAALEEFMLAFDPAILGIHDLVMHDYGMGKVFAVAHAEVPADSELVAIHDIIDALEKRVDEVFGIYLVLHIDPVDTKDVQLETLKKQVMQVLASVDEHYTAHDFRLSEDGKKMYFDLVIDSDIKKDTQHISEMVKQRIIACIGDAIEPVVHVEFSFTQK